MVLLLAVAPGTPAEEQQRLDPVQRGLDRPGRDLPVGHGRVVAGPVHRPRLLLDDPGPPAQALRPGPGGQPGPACEVQQERHLLGSRHAVRVAVEGAQPAGAPDGHRVDVHVAEVEVGEDRHAGAGGLDQRALLAEERRDLARGEPPVGELERRVVGGHRRDRQRHRVEVGVGHRPERGAPRGVQGVDAAVALAQPGGEGQLAVGAPAARGVVVAGLVVQLPGAHRGAVAIGEHADDAAGLLAVGRRGRARVAAAPVGAAPPVRADGQDRGPFARQPDRGRGGRRAEDHLQPVVLQRRDRAVEPAQLPSGRGRARSSTTRTRRSARAAARSRP